MQDKFKSLVSKYNLKVATRDGQKGFILPKQVSTADIDFIRQHKQDIIDYIELLEQQKEAEKKAKLQQNIELQKPYLKLAIVTSGHYMSDIEIMYVLPLTDNEQSKYQDWAKKQGLHKVALDSNTINIKKARPSDFVKQICNRKSNGVLGSCESQIWYIAENEKQSIIDIIAKTVQDEQEAIHNTKKVEDERIASIFALAKSTAEKQVLSKNTVDCNDQSEECSTDIITVYAMPDGSTKTVRTHTW